MRTIIELTQEQIAALDKLRKRRQASRASLIREAVDQYLGNHSPAVLTDRLGFGAWKHKRIEGIKHQRGLRQEWER